MNKDTLNAAIREAERFVKLAKACQARTRAASSVHEAKEATQ